MMDTSDTPRTDAVTDTGFGYSTPAVPVEFAQGLERENNALRAELDKAKNPGSNAVTSARSPSDGSADQPERVE